MGRRGDFTINPLDELESDILHDPELRAIGLCQVQVRNGEILLWTWCRDGRFSESMFQSTVHWYKHPVDVKICVVGRIQGAMIRWLADFRDSPL